MKRDRLDIIFILDNDDNVLKKQHINRSVLNITDFSTVQIFKKAKSSIIVLSTYDCAMFSRNSLIFQKINFTIRVIKTTGFMLMEFFEK